MLSSPQSASLDPGYKGASYLRLRKPQIQLAYPAVAHENKMAPPAADVDLASPPADTVPVTKSVNKSAHKEPLKYSGSLDQYKAFDVTNVIGREFPDLQLSSILNDDTKLRDLAITGMYRHSPG